MAIFTMYERFYYRYFKFNIERSLRFGWDSFEIFMAISDLSKVSQARQDQFLDSTHPGAAGRENARWRIPLKERTAAARQYRPSAMRVLGKRAPALGIMRIILTICPTVLSYFSVMTY